MEKNSSATADTDMPPIPTFSFGNKVKQVENDTSPDELGSASVEQSRTSHNRNSPAKRAGRGINIKKDITEKEGAQIVGPPVTFSTEVRRSIQTDLAIISYKKGMTIKRILHEAFTLWLASPDVSEIQKQKKLKLMQLPERDPIDSFSNRIRSDLKRQLAKLKFEREGVQHPIRTIGAFTEEALINWIPQQSEFSVEERSERLSQKAA